ncbi:MAG: hypothetical protein WCJ94_00040 [bacterium]
MKKLIAIMILMSIFTNIFPIGGTIPTGLPTNFGFGCIDKADSYATDGPHFYKGTTVGTCWDYSYAYLTSDFASNTWTNWVASGAWAKQELQYWESKGQIQVFSFYYTPYTLSNYTQTAKMKTYFQDFKLLCQIIATNSTKKVIIHIEPDLLGFWRKAGKTATSTGAVVVGSAVFGETCDGIVINNLPDTIAGWSEALYRIKNQYGGGKVLLAHHYTHWGNVNSKDVIIDSSLTQTDINTNVDDTTSFINQIENGNKYDLIFVDPSDRDADWYRVIGGASNTRWTDPSHSYSSTRSWGKLGYIYDRVSTNLDRRLMFWQVPVGNTYYTTCNNSSYHYRDNSAQEFIPSTTADGTSGSPGDAYLSNDTSKGPGYWATRGFIGILFGEGGYDHYSSPNDMCHLRDYVTDGITNPGSDANAGGPSFDVWGKAVSNSTDNDGGYIRAAVAKYCSTGKYSLIASPVATATNTKTNTPQAPTATTTKTNTPQVPSATTTFTPSKTSTQLIPTFTSTNTPKTPTYTITSTSTVIYFTPTSTVTSLPPTATITNTAVLQTVTITITKTITPIATVSVTDIPVNSATATMTKTVSPVITNSQTSTQIPTSTLTNIITATVTPTNMIAILSPTSTKVNTVIASITMTATQKNTIMPSPTMTITRTLSPIITNTIVITATAINSATIISTMTSIATATFTSTIAVDQGILSIPSPPMAYPNPYTGQQLNIKFSISSHATKIAVKIYTISRRLIRKVQTDGVFHPGDCYFTIKREYLLGLSKGTYLYQIIINDSNGREAKSKTGTIIIQ